MKIQRILKFQVGGSFAAYTVPYIPISALTTAGAYDPGPTTRDAASSRGSKSSENELSMKDILKVFDDVKGLPIDVNYVLKDFLLMFTNDILLSVDGKPSYSSLVNYYLSNLGKFNQLRESKEQYDKVREELIKNNSLDEIAVNNRGNIIVQTEDGIDAISLKEFKENPESFRPLTNHELLELRLKNLPFGDSIYSSMTGVGMDSIIKRVNAVVQNLGSSDKKLEGYTAKQSNDIRSGLTALQEAKNLEGSTMTVDGLYKNSILTKDLTEQAKLALLAVYNSLTPLEKTILGLHSLNGMDTLSSIIFSRTSSKIEFEPTLQAHLNLDGSPKKTEKEKQEAQRDVNPLLMMQMMQGGEQKALEIQTTGTEALSVPAKYYSAIPKADSGPMSVEQMLSSSGLSGMLQGEGITFGDLHLSRINLNSVMYDNNGGYMALLPCITDTFGNKYVDLSILDEYKEVTKNVHEEIGTPAYYQALAKGLKEKGLDELLTGSDTLNLNRFQQFFVFRGYTTDGVLKENPKFKDSQYIKEISDPAVADRMKKALSTKENGEFEIDPYDKLGIFEFWNGWDDIYSGTVYVPITANQNSPYMAYGLNIKLNIADQNETDYLIFNSKLKSFNPNNSFIQ